MSDVTLKVDMYPHDDVARLHSELTAARDEVEKLRAKADKCEREARQWRQEARTQSDIVAKIYQAVTGKKGEPGDWNGAVPVVAELERLRGRVAALESRVCRTCDGHGMIGGPSYSQPDEGGEPCPECAGWLLRKQAEAVEAFAEWADPHWPKSQAVMIKDDARSHAFELRQQADDIERGEPK